MTTENTLTTEETSVEEKKVVEFLITKEGREKGMRKTSVSSLVIQALKRAKGQPLGLRAIANRVASTKAGKKADVKNVKVRARTCAKWWAKNEPTYVGTDEKGRLFLIQA